MPVGKRKTIRYGLGAIKGTGESAIESIIEARKNGPFNALFDFCHRVDKRIVNRRVVESLIRAGAFDAIDAHRAGLLASVGIALESAEQAGRAANQVSLFGESDARLVSQLGRINVPSWSEKENWQTKDCTGLLFKRTSFQRVCGGRKTVRPHQPEQTDSTARNSAPAGIVYAIRIQMTRRGRMGVVVLDDGSARVEFVLYNELFESVRAWLKEDQFVVAEAKVFNRGGEGEYGGELRISADQLYTFDEARSRFAKRMELHCNGMANAARLRELLGPYRAGHVNGNGNGSQHRENKKGISSAVCPVAVVYRNGSATCTLELGDEWRVSLRENLLESLRANFSVENVKIIY